MQFCSWTHLGSTAAIAFAPSTPISFQCSFNVFSGALTKPSRNEQRKEMGELAGDKYSIQKRATRCILPRKRRRDGLRAFDAESGDGCNDDNQSKQSISYGGGEIDQDLL